MKQKLWKVGVRGERLDKNCFFHVRRNFAIHEDIYYLCCLLYSRTFILMNVHQLQRGVRISGWFCLEYGMIYTY